METEIGRPTKYGEEVIRNVQGIAGYSMIGLALGFVFAFLMAGSLRGIGILAIAALACYAIGSGFGFLFSIPRSAQPDAGAPAAASDAAGRKIIPRDNTNLEQISDWLVKILIGASLVQLGEVKKLIDSSATKLSASLSGASGSIQTAKAPELTNALAAAASTNGAPSILTAGIPSPAGDTTGFCLFLILYFLGLGFFTGYLITKLWLPFVMLRTAQAMEQSQLDADEERARKEGARAALQSFGITTADPPPRAGAAEVSDDPNKGQFGGQAEANGLRLTGKVQKMDDIDEDYFRITLKVTPTTNRTLDKIVTFHLHPTFDPAVVPVTPTNNEATLARAAWGAFTVGATIDGEPTKLELDLADLPDAPALFRSR